MSELASPVSPLLRLPPPPPSGRSPAVFSEIALNKPVCYMRVNEFIITYKFALLCVYYFIANLLEQRCLIKIFFIPRKLVIQ